MLSGKVREEISEEHATAGVDIFIRSEHRRETRRKTLGERVDNERRLQQPFDHAGARGAKPGNPSDERIPHGQRVGGTVELPVRPPHLHQAKGASEGERRCRAA